MSEAPERQKRVMTLAPLVCVSIPQAPHAAPDHRSAGIFYMPL